MKAEHILAHDQCGVDFLLARPRGGGRQIWEPGAAHAIYETLCINAERL